MGIGKKALCLVTACKLIMNAPALPKQPHSLKLQKALKGHSGLILKVIGDIRTSKSLFDFKNIPFLDAEMDDVIDASIHKRNEFCKNKTEDDDGICGNLQDEIRKEDE